MRSLRRRIERLEARQPPEIILTLRDGTHFHFRGPAQEFFREALEDIRKNRTTPLLRAVLDTVSAKGCGLRWQFLQAIASSPKE
jgi:hypothetical protein